jgi:hypothetical protein
MFFSAFWIISGRNCKRCCSGYDWIGTHHFNDVCHVSLPHPTGSSTWQLGNLFRCATRPWRMYVFNVPSRPKWKSPDRDTESERERLVRENVRYCRTNYGDKPLHFACLYSFLLNEFYQVRSGISIPYFRLL